LLQTYETAAAENEAVLDDVISLVERLPLQVDPLTGEGAAQSARNALPNHGGNAVQSSIVELARSIDATLVTADKETCELYPGCLFILDGSNGRNRDIKREAFG
jgi:predicted nucleic acid-binding protein